ncbi:ArsR family transcriptional regulator [Methylococcaceae bacterium HT1]|nr:ArsR family transcriptional regulator [Methylococcaceae bacterium HT1]TXL22140.1 ArsR family transcriptional regulator [Methylococcaceae bacterium HT2]
MRISKYNLSMNPESLANLFKALSEPTRVRILVLLLNKGELCVCDLVDTLALSQSVISRHLAYLRNNDIVVARREGVWMYYQLSNYAQSELMPLFNFIQNSSANSKEVQADLANVSKVNSC